MVSAGAERMQNWPADRKESCIFISIIKRITGRRTQSRKHSTVSLNSDHRGPFHGNREGDQLHFLTTFICFIMHWNRLGVLIQAIMAPLMGHDNKQEGGGNFFCVRICLQCKGDRVHKAEGGGTGGWWGREEKKIRMVDVVRREGQKSGRLKRRNPISLESLWKITTIWSCEWKVAEENKVREARI